MNDIDKMPPKCRDCAFWEIAREPYVCTDCESRMERLSDFSRPKTDEYIKRSDAVEEVKDFFRKGGFRSDVAGKYLLNRIEKHIPAADVEPVRHGRWVSKEGIYGVVYCSICDFELKIDNTPRCPHCGAKMDAEPPKGEDDAEVH